MTSDLLTQTAGTVMTPLPPSLREPLNPSYWPQVRLHWSRFADVFSSGACFLNVPQVLCMEPQRIVVVVVKQVDLVRQVKEIRWFDTAVTSDMSCNSRNRIFSLHSSAALIHCLMMCEQVGGSVSHPDFTQTDGHTYGRYLFHKRASLITWLHIFLLPFPSAVL